MRTDSEPDGRITASVAEVLGAGAKLRTRIEAECKLSRELDSHPGDLERAERWRAARRSTEHALRAYHLAVGHCEQAARDASTNKVSRRGLVGKLAGVAAALATPSNLHRRPTTA